MDNLLPAIVQDALSGKVLMQGYMNQDALATTLDSGKVTFLVAQNCVCGKKAKPQAIP